VTAIFITYVNLFIYLYVQTTVVMETTRNQDTTLLVRTNIICTGGSFDSTTVTFYWPCYLSHWQYKDNTMFRNSIFTVSK